VDIKSLFFNFRIINYFIYRFKYPYLSLSPSSTIIGKIDLEENINIAKTTQLIGNIHIGRNSTINENCKIFGQVDIGDNCLLSNNIFISSGGHVYNKVPTLAIKEQDVLESINKKIIIEDDCWIGINVVIMAGIRIKKGSIIGANSVVTKDIEPYTIVGGVPAKVIKKRYNFILKKNISFNKIEDIPYFYKGFLVREYEKKRFSIYDGLLTKNKFELQLSIIGEKILFLEVKKYKKNAKLRYNNQELIIDSEKYITIEINIKENTPLVFLTSEPIIIKKAWL